MDDLNTDDQSNGFGSLDSAEADDLFNKHLSASGQEFDDLDDDDGDSPDPDGDDNRERGSDRDGDDKGRKNDGFDDDPDFDEDDDEWEDDPDFDEDDDEDEDLDDDEEEEEDDDEDEDLDDDEESFLDGARLPKGGMERIQKNKDLKAVYNGMQRHFTRQNEERNHQLRQLESERGRYNQFRELLRDPKKFVPYMTNLLRNERSVGAEIFSRVASGKDKGEFLVAMAIEDPSGWDAAAEEVEALREDKDKLELYKERLEVKAERNRTRQQQQDMYRQRFDQNLGTVRHHTLTAARSLRIEKDNMDQVFDAVAEQVKANSKKDGTIELSAKEIRSIVKAEKAKMDRWERKYLARRQKKDVRSKQKSTRRRASNAKRRGKRSSGPRNRAGAKVSRKRKSRGKPKSALDQERALDRGLSRSFDKYLDAQGL